MNILVNAFGIADSGGVRVLEKFVADAAIMKHDKNFIIMFNNFDVFLRFKKLFGENDIFEFRYKKLDSFIYRIIYENIFFKKIIKTKKINLIYNFSGTSQIFIKQPQLLKMHNLLFFSKKLNEHYFSKYDFILWLQQVYIKSIFFRLMLSLSNNIEIQSKHVADSLSKFINLNNKKIYIKSDIQTSPNDFKKVKNYNFSNKIKFLYIVGPHFEYPHKNFNDFVLTMLRLKDTGIDFEINITLTKNELENSRYWDSSLNSHTNFYGYISDSETLDSLFCDNAILISTSIIETLGLHVIEAIKNGIISIVPNEEYSKDVYGNNMFFYDLHDVSSLTKTILSLIKTHNFISDKIRSQQAYLVQNEGNKFNNMQTIFDEVNNV